MKQKSDELKTSTNWMKLFLRRSSLFFYYCSPCLIAIAVVLGTNYQRVRVVAGAVIDQVCKQPQRQTSESPPTYAEELKDIMSTINRNGWNNCDPKHLLTSPTSTGPRFIWGKFLTGWFSNALFILILSLLPFGILGVGLARKYDKQESYSAYTKIAFKDFLLKYLVGFIIAMGWLYLFNPKGQAAGALGDWLKNADVISKNSAPNFFDLKDSTLKYHIVAVFGWYLYLLGYFFNRFRTADVLGTRIYTILFKKFLFVIGVALIISSAGGSSVESLILVFLIGMFPLSAITLLTEFGSKRLTAGEEQTSLSIFPGISTWEILRLEEEGIDSVSSLATANVEELTQVISNRVISSKLLGVWIDKARLATVVGAKRWIEINGICETASEFVKKQSAHDPAFVTKLAEKNIFNADEISTTLQRTFGLMPQ